MAKRQTRRSISVRGATYLRLDRLAKQRGESVSGILERLAEAELTAAGIPVPDASELTNALERKGKRREVHGGGCFTF